MKFPSMKYSMNKKGQVVLGIIIIVTLLAVGTYSTTTILSNHRYIGDSFNNYYYDLSKCIIEVTPNNLVYFENKNDAIKKGFKSAGCNG